MPATTKAPSTAPEENPLAKSLASIVGEDALSQTTGTASPIAYDPDQAFRAPEADVINISGSPGTGATTSETWSHDIALENLRREQLQFEYEQQQAAIANELRAQESARAEAQLGLTKAEAARSAGLYPTQKATAEQALASARQDAALKAAAGEAAAREAYTKYPHSVAEMKAQYQSMADQNRYQAGEAISPQSVAAYQQLLSDPGYIRTGAYVPNMGVAQQPMIYRYNSGGGGYVPAPVYQPPLGINGRPTQQVYNTPYVRPAPTVSGKLWG